MTIRKAVPGATAAIRYRIPTFVLHGSPVHLGAYATHIGYYPGASRIQAFAPALSRHDVANGTVRFAPDQPISYGLIE
jgi:uncharacterized protein YdhG (YjbR/CyaY superfamily)